MIKAARRGYYELLVRSLAATKRTLPVVVAGTLLRILIVAGAFDVADRLRASLSEGITEDWVRFMVIDALSVGDDDALEYLFSLAEAAGVEVGLGGP